ncbi:hypothetical protein [Saccharibacillus deserti]|uniref:hypothetical protein n=1 Tax=Saccharibacillus deserti TaxID=1634444 RepID=UPI0015531C45|nr:hypothetical protein [Saccharibacillus deserti]
MYRMKMTALIVMLLLAGCASAPENTGAPAPKAASSNPEVPPEVREYAGSGDAWAAEYSMYVPEQGGKLRARLTARYEGGGPSPTGEVKYSYYGADIEAGSGGTVVKRVPENGVYLLRDLVTTEYVQEDAGTVELLLIWDGGDRSETIRLEPADEF